MTVQDLLDKIGLLPTEPSDIPGAPPAELVGFVVRWNRGLRQWKKSTLADFASVSVSTVERVERGEKVSEEALAGLGRPVLSGLRETQVAQFAQVRRPVGDAKWHARIAPRLNRSPTLAHRPIIPPAKRGRPELNLPRAEAAARLQERGSLGKDLRTKLRSLQSRADLLEYDSEFDKWHDYNKELLNGMFTNNILEKEYKSVRFAIIPALDTDQELSENFTEVADRCITKLQSILERLGFYLEVPGGQKVARDGLILRDMSKVFVVHGHDDGAREAVARFLEQIGLVPIILHEQSNQGRTIVEKFEAHAEVDFAVVLLTPDDVGGPKGGAQQPRARQNVILELGYFIGKLGRQNVCALKFGDLEIPSDIMGVLWTPFDAHGAWKTALAKELRDAGHTIDWDKVMGP